MTAQKQSQVTNEILQGNLLQLMFKLSIPGIFGMFIVGLNSFTDILFAGQFIGETAVAGISLASPLLSIIGAFASLIGVGSASVLSRAIGSGDIKTQSKIFGNLIVMSVVISFIITIIGYSFGKELILFMGGSGEVASAGTEYFKTNILGSVFVLLAIGSSQLIKSEGKIRLSMIFAGIFSIINIILDIIFINIFHWKITGLALAEVIAMAVYSILNLTYFLSGKSSLSVNPKKLILARDLLPDILSSGSSNFLLPMMSLIQSFVVLKSISHYGIQSDIAFYGATLRLNSLVSMPIGGFTQALQPVIGINYGARNYDRLKKAYLTFLIGAAALLTLLWLILTLSPKTFLGWLLPHIIFSENNLLNFHILNLLIPMLPFIYLSGVVFQSIGKGGLVTILLILRTLILFIPLVLVLSKFLGINGIYYGIVMNESLILLIILTLMFREFQHLNKMPSKKH